MFAQISENSGEKERNIPSAGVIKLPMLGGIKHCKGTVTLRHFPYDSALLGLLI